MKDEVQGRIAQSSLSDEAWSAKHGIVCHGPDGPDRCEGCLHYYGRAEKCIFATESDGSELTGEIHTGACEPASAAIRPCGPSDPTTVSVLSPNLEDLGAAIDVILAASCEDQQLAATMIAGNIGMALTNEPPHPDCPHAVADTRRTDSSESPLPASFSAPPSPPTPAQSTAGLSHQFVGERKVMGRGTVPSTAAAPVGEPIGYISPETLVGLCDPHGAGQIVAAAAFTTTIPLYTYPPAPAVGAEEVARIIDPVAWTTQDRMGKFVTYVNGIAPSLEKADAILSLLSIKAGE